MLRYSLLYILVGFGLAACEEGTEVDSPYAVDLGLSVQWSWCNLGASLPEEHGDSYVWGSCGTSDDAAHVMLGDNWRMPTAEEVEELIERCTWDYLNLKGVSGHLVTGPNGNQIFLPIDSYWSGSYSSSPWSLSTGGFSWSSNSRSYIRPVKGKLSMPGDIEDNDDATNKTYSVNGVSFKMIFVEGGTFTMGATNEQGSDADSDERPTHQVTLSNYYIGETEVTQMLWIAVMGSNPSYFTGDLQRPVECVSWNDCQTFITKLNQLTGENFRLPTEAEWEYAARGGSASKGYKYSGSNSVGDVAWYYDNSSNKTHVVKTKQPNELGIYDMSGNVWEWCSDWYGDYSSSAQTNPTGPLSGSDRVLRGGGWFYGARYCRVAYRDYSSPGGRDYCYGLRLVRQFIP